MRIPVIIIAAFLLAAPARSAEITVGLQAAPTSADPHFHQLSPNNALARHVFGTLVRSDADMNLAPELALSWTNPDDRTWLFALDPAARFHDGTPFTALDVVFSLCRAMSGVGPTRSFTSVPKALESVEVPDPHSIILRTARPEPVLLSQLAGFAIISARSAGVSSVSFAPGESCGLTALPPSSDFDNLRMANGTGRYRLTRYTNGDAIVLEGTDRAKWGRVTLKPVPSTGARLAGLLSGDFDLIENPSAQDLPVLKQRGGMAWTVTPSQRIIFLQPDIGRASSPMATAPDGRNPLADARVRQAISLAIDRRAIATRLMDGLAEPATQYQIAGQFGALPTPPALEYNPERARKLLAEAGYKDGFTLTLSATNNRYINDAQVAQALGQYLTRIGIRTAVDAMTQTVFFPRRAKKDFSLSMGGWSYGSPEASDLFRYFTVSPDPARGLGGSNYGFYGNPAFDAALLPALEDMNTDRRRTSLEKATQIALSDLALIPLYWETSVWAYRDRYSYQGRIDQITDVDGLSPKKP
jgi:peptide/nickel transport system substrate-binding protein